MAASALLALSRSDTDTLASPAFAASNHAALRDVQLQYERCRFPAVCVPLVSQSNSRACDSALCEMRRTTLDGRVTRTLPWLSFS